jgi:hypothetical protein
VFAPGTVLVVDKGFTDYHLFHQWSQAGIFLVTRMRAHAQYLVVEERPVPQHRGILRDQVVYWANPRFHFGRPQQYRRIELVHPETGEVWVLLSNHLEWGATMLAHLAKSMRINCKTVSSLLPLNHARTFKPGCAAHHPHKKTFCATAR